MIPYEARRLQKVAPALYQLTIDALTIYGGDLICEKFHIKPTELLEIFCGTWYECNNAYHCIRASTEEDTYIIPDMTYPECIFRYHGNLNSPRNSKLIKRIIHNLIYRGYKPEQIEECLKPYARPFTLFYNPQKGDVWD